MMKKPPPALINLQFISSHLKYRYVTYLKIHVELKAVEFCKDRIFSYNSMIKNNPLLWWTYNLTATI